MTEEESFEFVRKKAEESATLRRVAGEALAKPMVELAEVICGVLGSGGKLLICGNGGSAADSSHMATEMIVRLTAASNRQSLPAIALTADSSVLTAAANDFGFEQVFARQIEGLGKEGDMLFLISTSGNSPNLIKAVAAARERRMLTAALLGGNGGQLAGIVERPVIIPHSSVQRIQEEQIFIIHLLVELVEDSLCGHLKG